MYGALEEAMKLSAVEGMDRPLPRGGFAPAGAAKAPEPVATSGARTARVAQCLVGYARSAAQ